jgi:hypothetical protein
MIKRYDVYETAEFGTMREYCETGCHVDADDAVALAESHARLLEALVKIERRTFQHSDDDAADHRRNLHHAHSIAKSALATAQPLAEKVPKSLA